MSEGDRNASTPARRTLNFSMYCFSSCRRLEQQVSHHSLSFPSTPRPSVRAARTGKAGRIRRARPSGLGGLGLLREPGRPTVFLPSFAPKNGHCALVFFGCLLVPLVELQKQAREVRWIGGVG